MDIENKLDEDFLFYLGFTNSFLHCLADPAEVDKCRLWLQKLCGEAYTTKEQKRNRNIFLSNLVLCMQNGTLSEPFTFNATDIDVSECVKYFGDPEVDLEEPDWLEDVVEGRAADAPARDDGRTYVATRTMPGGQGAFAYIAVTLADVEPRWLGGGEGEFDRQMGARYAEMVPNINEMEMILARRKNPRERQKVITFYDVVIKNINEELDGSKDAAENETVNVLMEQLVANLQSQGQYEQYENMAEDRRRGDLLLQLFDLCKSRRDKISKREEVLDDLTDRVLPKSFFETSMVEEDQYQFPSLMWEQAINKAPARKYMDSMNNTYVQPVVTRFVELLTNQKEEIAMRLQKRHEHIVAQMRKELRKEGELGMKKEHDAQTSCDHSVHIMKAVLKARQDQYDSEQKYENERKKGGITKVSAKYEQMRQALLATQQDVEAEADRGWHLTMQINALNKQTQVYQQVNDESILKVEEANMQIMKNIKRLTAAVKTHEGTVRHIQGMIESAGQGGSTQQYMF